MKKYAYAQQMNTMNMSTMMVDSTGAIVVKRRQRHARDAADNEELTRYAKILESIETLKV
jgi:hypothetical protein